MATRSAAKRRLSLIVVVGGLALLAVRLVAPAAEHPEPASAPATSTRSRDGAPRPATAAPELQIARLESLRGGAAAEGEEPAAPAGPFAAHSWQPPPPPPPKAPPPEPPRAPAFAYLYFGGLTSGAVRTGYFIKGNRVVALRSGDVLDGFRVDSLDETQATLTYLPLEQTSTITFGSTQ